MKGKEPLAGPGSYWGSLRLAHQEKEKEEGGQKDERIRHIHRMCKYTSYTDAKKKQQVSGGSQEQSGFNCFSCENVSFSMSKPQYTQISALLFVTEYSGVTPDVLFNESEYNNVCTYNVKKKLL